MYVDVPADQLLPELEKGIKKQMEDVMLGEKKKVVIEKLEWTKKGIRVWIQTKK